jgi:hypothetical protein
MEEGGQGTWPLILALFKLPPGPLPPHCARVLSQDKPFGFHARPESNEETGYALCRRARRLSVVTSSACLSLCMS